MNINTAPHTMLRATLMLTYSSFFIPSRTRISRSERSLFGASAHLSALLLKASGSLLLPLPSHLGGGFLVSAVSFSHGSVKNDFDVHAKRRVSESQRHVSIVRKNKDIIIDVKGYRVGGASSNNRTEFAHSLIPQSI